MARMNFTKLPHAGKAIEARERKPVQGCNTNVKRQPVRIFSDVEEAAWLNATMP